MLGSNLNNVNWHRLNRGMLSELVGNVSLVLRQYNIDVTTITTAMSNGLYYEVPMIMQLE